ncbi:OmpA family protein [Glacieibacterium frigidum]|uniref:OmpA family protein n=1 Tax=Glacieibacterium frigidum TaxID=2593303 RepID=A0A552UAX1_9SPHN|nr:OmpA family protein [Glacieibacterium frigidum]TRW15361.1 OmpA family protein [Glacieibacterium frigidum]
MRIARAEPAVATRPAIALLAACLGLALAGCDGRVSQRSLKDEPSSFRLVVDAPESKLVIAGATDSGGTAGPESSFGEAAAPSSVMRSAEVAPERLALTTNLLSDLKARQTDDQSIVVDLPADVLFDFDKASLRTDAEASLRKVADLLESYPTAPVKVNGHTDAKGSDDYNDRLSLDRANTVAAWLKRRGDRAISIAGLGERQPVAENATAGGGDNPDGRQRNRRVEIVIQPVVARGLTQG